MLSELKKDLGKRVATRIRELYGIDHEPLIEVPPRRELGDLSFPAALKLARELKQSPRAIGEAIAAGLEMPPVVRELRVEGAGFLNVYFDRPAIVARLLAEPVLSVDPERQEHKTIIEHTNINPNKAAHIGHLRNAVLGDVLARLLRRLGWDVEVQNYIDDTGVQVADVVVGFMDLRHLSQADVGAIPEPFDFYCWDLYSEVGRWFAEDPERQKLRRETLHELESGRGERANMARLVGRRVLQRHLATMARLDIGYDLLTHESHILGLDFFSRAAERLKASGAMHFEAEGKNAGCWVMPLADSVEFAGLEDPDKVIVRSDGTVTYVGKDIAYQLWKFGLLGKDFAYRYWHDQGVWTTALEGADNHPGFGGAERVINVIDARQSYLQRIVKAGLQSLGHHAEAERSVHFAYEMVSLSPQTARHFGFLGEDDADKSMEMSGRKGIGVKADDLLDLLIEKSREEISSRNREIEGAALDRLASQIATAALRFFMAKATTNRVIAFDLDEALSFEGESGPYLQYSSVRAGNILRKMTEAGHATEVAPEAAAALPAELFADDLWDLAWEVARIPENLEHAAAELELSVVARQGLDLAQKFNGLYHKHPILFETDERLRNARLACVQVFRKGMAEVAEVLGVALPERM